MTTAYADVAATNVFPEPTSPSRRRAIGVPFLTSLKMSASARVCPAVGVKGNRAMKRSSAFWSGSMVNASCCLNALRS